MKKLNVTVNNESVVFEVCDEWLDGVRIKAVGDPAKQIYEAALEDPERSGITTDDDMLNGTIDAVKKLVETAKAINREKGSDIRIRINAPDRFCIRFAGMDYGTGLSYKDAEAAIKKIRAYLDHNNVVKVRVFDGTGKSGLERAMDLEAFINSRAHKAISVADDGNKYTLVYIAKGFRSTGSDDDGEDEDC